MAGTIRVAGIAHNEAMWYVLGAETTAEAHWPGEMPRGIRDNLDKLRKAAEEFTYLAELVGVLLHMEGAEGVEGVVMADDSEPEANDGAW